MKTMLLAAMVLLAGCSPGNGKPTTTQSEPLESALIVGSAQSPDPILEKVRELEKNGVVKEVVVQESFPVQIRLRAPRQVIDELNRMPRTGALR